MKLRKKILIAILILITVASFISCMVTDNALGVDDTYFMRQYLRRLH